MADDLKNKPDSYWREKLTPEQYRVMREKGTEPPWSGENTTRSDDGVYRCAACGQELFSSDAKYESTTPGLQGWPAFKDVLDQGKIELKADNSFGMHRTEVVCKNCGSHLGHLFDDPTEDNKGGQHYCLNSCALNFKENRKS